MERKFYTYKKISCQSKDELQNIREECKVVSEKIEQHRPLLDYLPDNLRRSILLIEVEHLRPFEKINDLPEEVIDALNDISKIFSGEKGKLVERIKEAWEHRTFYDGYETFWEDLTLKTNLPYFNIKGYGSSDRWIKELTEFKIYLSTEEVAL